MTRSRQRVSALDGEAADGRKYAALRVARNRAYIIYAHGGSPDLPYRQHSLQGAPPTPTPPTHPHPHSHTRARLRPPPLLPRCQGGDLLLCARLLQALRWRLTRSRPGADRWHLIACWIEVDLLDCHSPGEAGSALQVRGWGGGGGVLPHRAPEAWRSTRGQSVQHMYCLYMYMCLIADFAGSRYRIGIHVYT